jgi:hypothetical protein
MKKYRFLTGICAAALVCGIWFTGCPEEVPPGEEEGWAVVKAASEIVGTWEGSITVPMEVESSLPASSSLVSITISYISGANATYTQKMDFSKYLDDILAASTANPKPSKDALWDAIKNQLYGGGDTSEKYLVKIEGPVTTANLLEDGVLFINQKKTKLKWVLDEDDAEAFGVEPGTEIIFTKK